MTNNDRNAQRIVFSGALTIRDADAIREKLMAALAAGGRVVVDCIDVDEVDITFIQLLIAARRSAVRMGAGVVLAQAAEGALLEALRRGGYYLEGRTHTEMSLFWITVAS